MSNTNLRKEGKKEERTSKNTMMVIDADDFNNLAYNIKVDTTGEPKRYFVGVDTESRYASVFYKDDDGVMELVETINF